jgi:hypothetical protein
MTGFLDRPSRDLWPQIFFCLHAAHSVWYAGLYPHGVYDPDLLAYFVYFRNFLSSSTSLHGIDYFTVPKPLLVFGLGPLADASLAFMITAVASAFIGSLVYLIGRETFGRLQGALMSAVLLLDIERATLTLRSSADLYVTVFLMAAIYASLRQRYLRSALAIGLATLVKPVALLCTVHLLAVQGDRRRWAWVASTIPLLFVPLVFASNYVLLGSLTGPDRFFAGFDSVSEGALMPTAELLRFVVWVQLVKSSFVATAPIGFLGMVSWLAADRRRLTHPFFLVPLLLLLAYVAMSVVTPFVPFFRFFWLVQVWFVGFIVHGIAQIGRMLGGDRRWARVAMMSCLLAFLCDDHLVRQLRYRHAFAGPFQDAMAFVSSTSPTLAHERHSGETILTPLAFVPYLLWQLDDAREQPSLLLTAEQWAKSPDRDVRPQWVLYVPESFLSTDTRALVEQLLATGEYRTRIVSGTSALLERAPAFETFAFR